MLCPMIRFTEGEPGHECTFFGPCLAGSCAWWSKDMEVCSVHMAARSMDDLQAVLASIEQVFRAR